jgi:site-specific DNA-cytosine methylase
MINEGDIAARIQNLQKTASYNSNDMLDPNYKTPQQREAAANEVAKLQEQVQVYKEMQGQMNSARQAANTAYANDSNNITSFDQALQGRSLSPAEYARIQQGQQGLRQAKAQVADKGTGLSSLSAEKQAGYEALSRILKDPSKLATIKKGAGSYSDFQKLLDNVR